MKTAFADSMVKLEFDMSYHVNTVYKLLEDRTLYQFHIEIEYMNFDKAKDKKKLNFVDAYSDYSMLGVWADMEYSAVQREVFACLRRHPHKLGYLTVTQII